MTLFALSDQDLLRRLRAGDEHAFTALYRRRQAGLYRFALQMSGSATIAEEVTQETFLALIEDAGRYDPAKGSVASFLYGIARNQVLRRPERARSVKWTDTEDDDPASVAAEGLDPLEDLTRRETVERVRRAVLSLPESYREVVVLCDLQEVSYAEAAAALDCAVGTIRSRLHRGRAA